MSERWFRLYDGIIDDPKIGLLSAHAFRVWVSVLCLASRSEGVIADNIIAIAYALRLTVRMTENVLNDLLHVGLLERCDGGFTPHNWDGRQSGDGGGEPASRRPMTSAERAHHYRNKKRDETRDASVTERVTERHKKGAPPSPPSSPSLLSPTPPYNSSPSSPNTPTPKRRYRARCGLPDVFPSPELLEKAREYWTEKHRPDLVAAEEAEQFRDHHTSRGSTMADWSAAWRSWSRNALKFNKPERANGNQQAKRSGSATFFDACVDSIREDEAREREADQGPSRGAVAVLSAPSGPERGPVEAQTLDLRRRSEGRI